MSVMRPLILTHHGGGRTGAARAEHRIALADHGNRLRDVGHLEAEVQVLGDAQAQGQVVLHFRRKARERRGDTVRTAHSHAGHDEPSIGLRHRLVRAARWLVNGKDGSARDDGALRVLDNAAHRAGRHALRVRATRGPQQDATNQKSKRSQQGSATHVFSMVRRHARPPYFN
jgi:hypothetical protein